MNELKKVGEGFIGRYWKIFEEHQAGKHPGQLTNIIKQMLKEAGIRVA